MLVVVAVLIFLVRLILPVLGLKVHTGALALSVILAFLADLIAIKISPVPDKWYFIRLFAIILVAAVAVTLFNRFLMESEAARRD